MKWKSRFLTSSSSKLSFQNHQWTIALYNTTSSLTFRIEYQVLKALRDSCTIQLKGDLQWLVSSISVLALNSYLMWHRRRRSPPRPSPSSQWISDKQTNKVYSSQWQPFIGLNLASQLVPLAISVLTINPFLNLWWTLEFILLNMDMTLLFLLNEHRYLNPIWCLDLVWTLSDWWGVEKHPHSVG